MTGSPEMDEPIHLKLVLIGNTSTGKTCLVKQVTSGLFADSCAATLGASFVSKMLTIGDREFKLQIWDTAGQERYRSMTPMYYRDAQAAMVVYSITDESSFSAIDSWVDSLHQNAEPGLILFLCGNKVDLADARSVSTENGREKARRIGAHFAEVSAKTGKGVADAFAEIPVSYIESDTFKERFPMKKVYICEQKESFRCC
jgi:Ras-related protein Rab-5C